ncbi:hypothetical protein PHLCEN_2v375 [Hermanssonia centrifuga]|uniref:Uncharacterized protein n=1 Tax=Hermanssonia centrifuga TaxID=98765 RepID=A0A2R6P1A7_9APHY|nr:hypothetical protein PHLCEN_2v5823 [Hermanssonia centrifuga]PSS37774.1 hypothetical protein PHLCEN_2v375 [Hermanssonia centrifuga]
MWVSKRYAERNWDRRTSIFFFVVAGAALSVGIYTLTTIYIKDRFGSGYPNDPLSFAVTFGEPVAMRVSDTAHFDLQSQEGIDEFAHALPSGGHLVYVRPDGDGSDPQPYTVTLFHQLRCLDVIRQQYSKVPSAPPPSLLHHCMNYVRHTILCRPHLLLEPAVNSQGTESREGGYDAVCHNWEAVYQEAERNYEAYTNWSHRASEA